MRSIFNLLMCMIFASACVAVYAFDLARKTKPKLMTSAVSVYVPMGFTYDEFVHTREYRVETLKPAGYVPEPQANERWLYSFDGEYMWYARASDVLKGEYVVRVPIRPHPRDKLPFLLQLYGGIEFDWTFDTRSKFITFKPVLELWLIAPDALLIAFFASAILWVVYVLIAGICVHVGIGLKALLRRRRKWHTSVPT